MFGPWQVVRFVHISSAAVWVGGLLVLAFLVIPVVRDRLGDGPANSVTSATARRFAFVLIGILLPVLLGTGLALIWHRGIDVSRLGETRYGQILIAKLVLLAVVLVLGVLHGVASGRGRPGLSRYFALGTILGSLAIVFVATALVP